MTSTSATTTTAIATTDVTTIVSIINAYATPTDTTINTITATASNITTIITASVITNNRQTAYRGRIVGLLALFNSITDGPTDGRTDTPSYRDARTHLKMVWGG